MEFIEIIKSLKYLIPEDLKKEFRRIIYLRKYKQLNLKIGRNVNIINSILGQNIYLGSNTTIKDSTIGDFSYTNDDSAINNTKIGKFCSISSKVIINLGEHPINFVSTHPAFYSRNKELFSFSDKEYFSELSTVSIGNDVWIGYASLIKGNIKIGNGAIIAANSVVTKDVAPYSIVGGIPAKQIKQRFNDSVKEIIEKSEWWNFDIKTLEDNFLLFHNANEFISKFGH